jgi:S1-C subfamily serine protease
MSTQANRRVPLLRRSSEWVLAIVLGAIWASVAFGQRPDLKPLLAQVDPAIVGIRTDNGRGFGVVVDAAAGLVATNYHVVAGATTGTVTTDGGNSCPVEGLLATMPGKDLALLRLVPGKAKLHALKIAAKPAVKGQAVYAGVPLGFTGVLSSGTVTAVRSGRELSDLASKLANPLAYQELLPLDPDSVWLQVAAPISPGRNGGPLVNADGELVGLTTVGSEDLYHAISAEHLKKLMATAGTTLETPFPPPPPPKPKPTLTLEPYVPNPAKGDLEKTLAAWKRHSKKRVAVDPLFAKCQRRLGEILLNSHVRGAYAKRSVKELEAIYEAIGEAGKRYAARVKALDDDKVDPELVAMIAAEAKITERLIETYRKVFDTAVDRGGPLNADLVQVETKHVMAQLRERHEVVRDSLSRKYNKPFPAFKETPLETDDDASVDQDRYRTWTSRSGRKTIQAKLIDNENGTVTLETPKGKKIRVDIEKLSDGDAEYIERHSQSPSLPKTPAEKPAGEQTPGTKHSRLEGQPKPPDGRARAIGGLDTSPAFAVLGRNARAPGEPLFAPIYDYVIGPHAVLAKETVFCVFQNSRGQPVAMAYQPAGKHWLGPVKVSEFGLGGNDDHGNPALCIDARGYLHFFYGCHLSPMRHAKSAKPYDIARWQELPTPAPQATYPQVMRMADGSIFLFYRAGGHMEPWTQRTSRDDGGTWGPPQPLVEMRKAPPDPLAAAYCCFLPGGNGRTVRLFWNHKDDNAAQVTAARPHPWRPLKYPGLHEAVYRYNVYYMKRGADGVWRDATGRQLDLPVSKAEADRRCLVYDSGDQFTNGLQTVVDAEDRPFVRFDAGVGDWTKRQDDPKATFIPFTPRFACQVAGRWQVSRAMPADWPAEVARIFRAPGTLVPSEQWPVGLWFLSLEGSLAGRGLGCAIQLRHDQAGSAVRQGGPAVVD